MSDYQLKRLTPEFKKQIADKLIASRVNHLPPIDVKYIEGIPDLTVQWLTEANKWISWLHAQDLHKIKHDSIYPLFWLE